VNSAQLGNIPTIFLSYARNHATVLICDMWKNYGQTDRQPWPLFISHQVQLT